MKLDLVTSSELLFMINQLPYSLKIKIPFELKSELYNNYNKEVYNSFIPDKPFYKQNIRDESIKMFYELVSEYMN